MHYDESVDYLYSIGNEVLTAKLGLDNITSLLRYLGNPHEKFRSVLIGGTNGKGSVAAFVESVLRASGLRTGLYTSPHLCRIEERVRVGGAMISETDFARLASVVKDAVAELQDPAQGRELRLDRHPTYFEMVTAIAFQYFAEQKIEVGVLEVGLGGRLDATNVVDPLVAVITNVDYDHQNYLGTTLEQIAFEKSGIIKPRTYQGSDPLRVICGSGNTVVKAIVEDRCRTTGATLTHLPKAEEFEATPDDLGRFRLKFDSVLGSRLDVQIPLPGEHQIQNFLTALRVLEALQGMGLFIDAASLTQGTESARWPGRLQIVAREPLLILDGAHNPSGAECLKAYCERFLRGRRRLLIFGVLRDKSIIELGETLFPLAEEIILTAPQSERAADPKAIAEMLPEFGDRYSFAKCADQALELAQKKAACDDVILVAGSLFLVGDIQNARKLAAGT
jgi:dihydrofolate synthase/folylpolyglutamate synthase